LAAGGDSKEAHPTEASAEDMIDFESVPPSASIAPESPAPRAGDDVEALLQRYHAEKGRTEGPALPPLTNGRSALANRPVPRSNGALHSEVPALANGVRRQLPPLTAPGGSSFPEFERVRTENAELRNMVGDLREYLEAHDPEVLASRLRELEQSAGEKDELIAAMKKQIDEWQEKLKTHRLVSADDEVALMADEVEKERCQIAQEHKQLEQDRQQLREDEESLMKSMRDMEMSMAKDRADVARQRTEMQRLHAEIKHELDVLQRGDATMKERLAQFQRRQQDVLSRAGAPPQATLVPQQGSPAGGQQAGKQDGVLKRLFGQS
jgi:hypothetical protein